MLSKELIRDLILNKSVWDSGICIINKQTRCFQCRLFIDHKNWKKKKTADKINIYWEKVGLTNLQQGDLNNDRSKEKSISTKGLIRKNKTEKKTSTFCFLPCHMREAQRGVSWWE